MVGDCDGDIDGEPDSFGAFEGPALGSPDGATDGPAVGDKVGKIDGPTVGDKVGKIDGAVDGGGTEGATVGVTVGGNDGTTSAVVVSTLAVVSRMHESYTMYRVTFSSYSVSAASSMLYKRQPFSPSL